MNGAHIKINLADFHEIPPEPSRLNELTICANSSGHISLSLGMRNKMNWNEICFSVNSKGDQIFIKQHTNEEKYHTVPPKSAISAKAVVKELVSFGVKQPARYIMYWDDEFQVWLGVLEKPLPKGPKAKRLPMKDSPDLKDLV